jgi:uncharacterized membrane protein YfcA
MTSFDFWKIVKSLFFLYVFWAGISYYFGLGKYDEEKEKQRNKRVEKYGFILIAASVIAFFSGVFLFLSLFF